MTMDKENTCEKGSQNSNNMAEEKKCPDGGWGWIVAIASMIVRASKQIIQPSFGIIFSGVLLEIGASSGTTSWIFNLYLVLEQCSKFFVGPLGDVLGWRAVVVTSGLISSLSAVALMYASSAAYLIIFFSILLGGGCGLAAATSHVVLASYFDKNRGKAVSIMLAGVCIGQFTSPMFLSYLLAQVGYKWSLLIIAGLLLNICLAGTVMHPVERHLKRDSIDKSVTNCEQGKNDDLDKFKGSNNNIETTNSSSTANLIKIGVVNTTAELFKKVLKALLGNFKAMKSLRVVFLSLSASAYMTGYLNFQMMIPFAMKNKGYTLDDAALCISIIAAFSGFSRILFPILSDWGKFNKKLSYMVGMLGLGVAQIAFTYGGSLRDIRILAAVVGIFTGLNNGLYSLVMIDDLGMQLFKASFGISGIFIAFNSIAVGPLIGLARDLSGSYELSMQLSGGVVLSGFIFLILLPLAVKFDKRFEK